MYSFWFKPSYFKVKPTTGTYLQANFKYGCCKLSAVLLCLSLNNKCLYLLAGRARINYMCMLGMLCSQACTIELVQVQRTEHTRTLQPLRTQSSRTFYGACGYCMERLSCQQHRNTHAHALAVIDYALIVDL